MAKPFRAAVQAPRNALPVALAALMALGGLVPFAGLGAAQSGGELYLNVLIVTDGGCSDDTPDFRATVLRDGAKVLTTHEATGQDWAMFGDLIPIGNAAYPPEIGLMVEEGESSWFGNKWYDQCDVSPGPDQVHTFRPNANGPTQVITRGSSANSAHMNVMIGTRPPPVPVLKVTSIGAETARLEWDGAPGFPVTGHELAVGRSRGGGVFQSDVASAGSRDLDGLLDNSEHSYRVIRRVSEIGAGDWAVSSPDVTFRTLNTWPRQPSVVAVHPGEHGDTIDFRSPTTHDIARVEIHMGPDGFTPGPSSLRSTASFDVFQPQSVPGVARQEGDAQVIVRVVDTGALSADSWPYPLGYAPPSAAGPALPPRPTPGAIVLQEDWDAGLGVWTTTGSEAAVACDGPGACALRLRPKAWGERVVVSRTMPEPPLGEVRAAFAFKGSTTWGDTDSDIVFELGQGRRLWFTITDGVGDNTGVTLTGAPGQSVRIGDWPQADTWYQVIAHADTAQGTVWAELLDADGFRRSSSVPIRIGADGEPTAGVRISGVPWHGDEGAAYYYDSIEVRAGSEPAPAPPPASRPPPSPPPSAPPSSPPSSPPPSAVPLPEVRVTSAVYAGGALSATWAVTPERSDLRFEVHAGPNPGFEPSRATLRASAGSGLRATGMGLGETDQHVMVVATLPDGTSVRSYAVQVQMRDAPTMRVRAAAYDDGRLTLEIVGHAPEGAMELHAGGAPEAVRTGVSRRTMEHMEIGLDGVIRVTATYAVGDAFTGLWFRWDGGETMTSWVAIQGVPVVVDAHGDLDSDGASVTTHARGDPARDPAAQVASDGSADAGMTTGTWIALMGGGVALGSSVAGVVAVMLRRR